MAMRGSASREVNRIIYPVENSVPTSNVIMNEIENGILRDRQYYLCGEMDLSSAGALLGMKYKIETTK
jgi:hypothetical protein